MTLVSRMETVRRVTSALAAASIVGTRASPAIAASTPTAARVGTALPLSRIAPAAQPATSAARRRTRARKTKTALSATSVCAIPTPERGDANETTVARCSRREITIERTDGVVTRRRLYVRHNMVMTLHLMLTGQGQEARSPRGLCGSTVAGLSFGEILGDRGRRPQLCPVCRSLALKVAATGHETVCSVGATHA